MLRPIKVSEQDFTSEVDHVTASGTMVFTTLRVSNAKVSRTAQMNAFNSDWFAETGAASVRPKEGERQRIGETSYTWQQIRATDGFVDFQTGLEDLDYSVGYAWTEFEAPALDPWSLPASAAAPRPCACSRRIGKQLYNTSAKAGFIFRKAA